MLTATAATQFFLVSNTNEFSNSKQTTFCTHCQSETRISIDKTYAKTKKRSKEDSAQVNTNYLLDIDERTDNRQKGERTDGRTDGRTD